MEDTPLVDTAPASSQVAGGQERRKIGWFTRVCHYIGHFTFRVTGNILLLVSLIGFEIFEVIAFYEQGLFTLWPVVVNILVFPGVVGVALLKESLLRTGVQEGSHRPPDTVLTTSAYVITAISLVACLAMPLKLRDMEVLNESWMWYSILGTVGIKGLCRPNLK